MRDAWRRFKQWSGPGHWRALLLAAMLLLSLPLVLGLPDMQAISTRPLGEMADQVLGVDVAQAARNTRADKREKRALRRQFCGDGDPTNNDNLGCLTENGNGNNGNGGSSNGNGGGSSNGNGSSGGNGNN